MDRLITLGLFVPLVWCVYFGVCAGRTMQHYNELEIFACFPDHPVVLLSAVQVNLNTEA